MNDEQKKLYQTGQTAFQTLCATCHGADAKGLPMAGAGPGAMLAPSLAGSKTINGHRDGGIKVLRHGLVGEIDGKKPRRLRQSQRCRHPSRFPQKSRSPLVDH
ncbi:MAG: c-type cytochrome [Verrucomicrobia bacterium]|nr:c-type cytochrome [Verrucomicrobiota bacterium]